MRRCWLLALGVFAACRFDFDAHGKATDAQQVDGVILNGDGTVATLGFAYLKASNTETFDNFGWDVAVSGDGSTIVVGAPAEDSGATGIDGDGTNNSVSQSGAVYVFVRSGKSWTQQAYIKPANVDPNDAFGGVLALSYDGNTLAAGEPNEDSAATTINGNAADNSAVDAGAVVVFVRTGTSWSQQAYIKADNTDAGDNFGWSVALSSTGDTLAIGAHAEDSAATGVGGSEASNASMDSGAAYVYTRAGATWSQQAYIKAWNTDSLDAFGESVALSADGSTLAVGAVGEDNSTPGIKANPVAGDDNNNLGIAGAAYVFARAGTTWSQQAYVKPSMPGFGGDFFGYTVAVSDNGDVLACAAPGEDSIVGNSGTVWMFRRSSGTWTEDTQLKASNAGDNDQFSASVTVAGDGALVMVGSPFEDSGASGLNGNQNDESSPDSGAVYVFASGASGWMQNAYAKSSAPDAGDQFGNAVALSRDGLTRVGACYYEDSAATGVDGDATNNGAPDSGAVGVSFYY